MAAIDNRQIRKIFAIGRAIGIVEQGSKEDALHSLVETITGKSSVKALTYSEAQTVISELQQRQGEAPLPRHKPKTHTERPGGATEGQQLKVWALMYQLQGKDAAPSQSDLGMRLCGILKKELKIDAVPADPLIWLDFQTCSKLIEILKKYVSNVKRQAPGGDAG